MNGGSCRLTTAGEQVCLCTANYTGVSCEQGRYSRTCLERLPWLVIKIGYPKKGGHWCQVQLHYWASARKFPWLATVPKLDIFSLRTNKFLEPIFFYKRRQQY